MKTILTFILLCLFIAPSPAQKISALPETLVLSNQFLFIVADPGRTNYKATVGTVLSNLASVIEGGGFIVPPPISGVLFNSNGTMQASSEFVFTNDNVGIGIALPASTLHVAGGNLTIDGGSIVVSNTAPQLFLRSYTTTPSLSGQIVNDRYRGTKTSPSAVLSGDVLGSWQAYGWGTTLSRQGVILEAKAYGPFSDSSAPAMFNIRVGTTNSGTTMNPVLTLTATWITNNANLVVNSNMVYKPGAGTAGDVLTAGDTAGTVIWATPAASGGGGSTYSNRNVFYVKENGNNATARPFSEEFSYRDPVAAANAATNLGGGTVVFFPGTYTTNNLLRNGVNFWGYPGTILNYVDTGVGSGRGIFDDRDLTNGGASSVIGGSIDVRYSTGTAGYNVGTINITPNPTNYLNILGAINLTNALSIVDVACSSLSVTSLITTLTVSAVNIHNCARFSLRCGRIYDPIYTNLFYIGDDDSANPVYASSGMLGIYWQIGKANVVVDNDIQSAIYAIWAHEPNGNTATQHLHVTVGGVIENNAGAHAVYLEGQTSGYKSWVSAHEIVGRGLNGAGAVGTYGAGRYYVTSQKISNPTTSIYSAVGTQETWISCPRVNSGGMGGGSRWVVQQGGKLDCVVSEWDDDGGIVIGWEVQGGELIVYPGQADVANGQGLNVSGAGKAKFVSTTINTSTGNLLANSPVVVSTNNVILQNCVLVAPTAAPAIAATTPKTVLSYNGITANKTNSPNITIQAGAFVVDSNVR